MTTIRRDGYQAVTRAAVRSRFFSSSAPRLISRRSILISGGAKRRTSMTMAYYTLGRSGLRVSRLALGTMTFGTDWGWGADKNTARELFDAYIERGGNLIDTADLYTNGVSEQWVGEFVRERRLRDRVAIATKFTFNADPTNPNSGGNGRKNMLRAVEGSLT